MLCSLELPIYDDPLPEVEPYLAGGQTYYSLRMPGVHLCGISRRQLEGLAQEVEKALRPMPEASPAWHEADELETIRLERGPPPG